MNDQPNANDIIDSLLEQDGLEPSERVWMFLCLCNDKAIIDELHKQAMLQKAGVVPASDIHSFAYAVMKLAKPHLFEGGGA